MDDLHVCVWARERGECGGGVRLRGNARQQPRCCHICTQNKEKKIKQGSGAEEAQLHALLIDMGPSAALLQECSELLELLVSNGT